ncbi:MAG: hypothetical protein NXI32_30420, partial [bacterium]|nr:hypothetical protein [bacterium]
LGFGLMARVGSIVTMLIAAGSALWNLPTAIGVLRAYRVACGCTPAVTSLRIVVLITRLRFHLPLRMRILLRAYLLLWHLPTAIGVLRAYRVACGRAPAVTSLRIVVLIA